MAQHDLNIANQVPANLRADLNNALSAIATNHSGTSAPATTYANMWWYDTTNDLLKIRNEADTAWITVGELDQTSGVWKPYVNGKQIADFLDEDDMTSDSATAVPSQQSVKKYVDDATITKTTGSPAYYGIRAFAVFDSGASPTVYGQNIASVSRASTGVFNVTFTTAMPDANYAVQVTADRGTIDAYCNYTARTTTGFQVRIFDQNANLLNPSSISVTVIR